MQADVGDASSVHPKKAGESLLRVSRPPVPCPAPIAESAIYRHARRSSHAPLLKHVRPCANYSIAPPEWDAPHRASVDHADIDRRQRKSYTFVLTPPFGEWVHQWHAQGEIRRRLRAKGRTRHGVEYWSARASGEPCVSSAATAAALSPPGDAVVALHSQFMARRVCVFAPIFLRPRGV